MTTPNPDISSGNAMGGPSFEVIEIGQAVAANGGRRRALDLGAGTGRNALYLAGKGFETTAVERKAANAAEAQRAQAAADVAYQLVQADIEQHRPDGPYDLCLALGILHFLPTATAQHVVAHLKAETTPGGLHVITLSHQGSNESYDNSLADQGYLNSFSARDALSSYADWSTLSHEAYVKRDTHADGVVETHPIEKFVFANAGRGAPAQVRVRTIPLVPRSDQVHVDAALATFPLASASRDQVRRTLGPADSVATATAVRPQLGLLAQRPAEYQITVCFWGLSKAYFENNVLVGTARYENGPFHQYLPPDLLE